MAEWEIKRSECPQCHGPVADCSDHEAVWYPQRTICYATMESAAANWRYDAIHDDEQFHDGTFENWSATRTRDFPYSYRDGVNVWVAKHDLTPDDDFLGALRSEHVAHGEADE